MSTETSTYRRDIDGLRFVAIVAVVIFHAFPKALPGGFVGVDVFFVISGFLISGIILKEIKNQRFSFGLFYARRFRRLLPALLLVLLTMTLAGALLFLPDEFKEFGKQLMGAGGFVANLVFWKEAGYFDLAGEIKPLLHLWSLGVEEQFYLIWPLTLFFILRQKKFRPSLLIFILLLASFILNVSQIGYDASSVFYGMSTRLWQFAFGALLALRDQEGEVGFQFKKGILSEVAAGIGFIAIIFACFKISQSLRYPGYWAMLPTLGSTLLIAIKRQSVLVRVLLENRVAVFIGLISYPLYLWHWPMLSILHITEGSIISKGQIFTALGLSFLFAFLTYKFVEKPIQRKLVFDNSRVIKMTVIKSLVLLLVVVGVGDLLYATRGLPQRMGQYNFNEMTFKNPADFMKEHIKGFICPKELGYISLAACREPEGTRPSIVVWGDSLTLALQVGLEDKGIASLMLSQGACPPFVDTQVFAPEGHDYCGRSNRSLMDYVTHNKDIKTVVLVSIGAPYIDHKRWGITWTLKFVFKGKTFDDHAKVYEEALRATIAELTAAGKKVVIYVNHAELPTEPKDCENARLFRFSKRTRPSCMIDYSRFLARQKVYWGILAKLQTEFPRLVLFKAYNYFCKDGQCVSVMDGKPLYTDVEHLSVEGADYMIERLIPFL